MVRLWLLAFFSIILTSSSSGNIEPNLFEIVETLMMQIEDLKSRVSTLENPTIEERLAHLEEIAKTKVLRTCDELLHHGVQVSGFYNIDPDGESFGSPPIQVHCDFESGVTEILHDSDDVFISIPHCTEEHCYHKEYNYAAQMEQITSLIQLSASCDQEIVFDCFLAPLSYNEVQIGTWSDRFGEEQVYFSGSNYGNHMWSCFTNNTCSGEDIFNTKCNCDNPGVPDWLEDAGMITNKTALPITAFSYGQMEYEAQQAMIKIGRLRCRGQAEVKMPPSSCNDLKKMGETTSGLYPLQDEENQQYPKLSYCDMSKPGYEQDMETMMGWMKFSSGPGYVLFSVVHSGGHGTIGLGETIKYDLEVVNNGGAMNSETGVFTATVAGLYEFKLSCMTYTTGELRIDINVNGDRYIETVDSYDGWSSVSRTWLLNLQSRDTVDLELVKGDLYGGIYRTEFIGVLL